MVHSFQVGNAMTHEVEVVPVTKPSRTLSGCRWRRMSMCCATEGQWQTKWQTVVQEGPSCNRSMHEGSVKMEHTGRTDVKSSCTPSRGHPQTSQVKDVLGDEIAHWGRMQKKYKNWCKNMAIICKPNI